MQEQIDALFRLARGRLGASDADAVTGQASPSRAGATKPKRKLTKRQREIASLIADGLSNEEIAGRLHISFDTARAHRSNVYGRLGVHSLSELEACRAEWERS